MKIEPKEITIKELCEGYIDKREEGVFAYGGKLDIRPPYQREFIYPDKERNAVIDTVSKNYPLNVMYWADREDDTYEVIDGQQRIISICEYVSGNFSIKWNETVLGFNNLKDEEKAIIENYKLQVYFCTGTPREKLKWFKTINIAGKPLTNQELNNAVYSGPWVSDAKLYFSKRNCVASSLGSKYVNGALDRQEYLETVIRWISNNNIEEYMRVQQNKKDAKELWNYFQDVISWIEVNFKVHNDKISYVEWGLYYNELKNKVFDIEDIKKKVNEFILDDDVTKKSGIYPYIFTGEEKYLNIRAFTDNMKLKVYTKQSGKCLNCREEFNINEMEADHIIPWSAGGKTDESNCQMLCTKDHKLLKNR